MMTLSRITQARKKAWSRIFDEITAKIKVHVRMDSWDISNKVDSDVRNEVMSQINSEIDKHVAYSAQDQVIKDVWYPSSDLVDIIHDHVMRSINKESI